MGRSRLACLKLEIGQDNAIEPPAMLGISSNPRTGIPNSPVESVVLGMLLLILDCNSDLTSVSPAEAPRDRSAFGRPS